MLQDSDSGSVPLPASGRGKRLMGVAAGTQIRSELGEVAVEQLAAGDRVLTRNDGLQVLRAIGVTIARDIEVVCLAPGALGRPPGARELVVPAQQQIILRDWRAKAIFGRDALPTPAGALAGEALVRRETLSELQLFQLHFDSPQVIWANGLELASTRIAAPSPHSRAH